MKTTYAVSYTSYNNQHLTLFEDYEEALNYAWETAFSVHEEVTLDTYEHLDHIELEVSYDRCDTGNTHHRYNWKNAYADRATLFYLTQPDKNGDRHQEEVNLEEDPNTPCTEESPVILRQTRTLAPYTCDSLYYIRKKGTRYNEDTLDDYNTESEATEAFGKLTDEQKEQYEIVELWLDDEECFESEEELHKANQQIF